MANEIVKVETTKALVHQKMPTLHLATKQIKNPHKFQLFIDAGTVPGPWISIGFNDTLYGVGYLPTAKKKPTKKVGTSC